MVRTPRPPGPCEHGDCAGAYEDMGEDELYCDTCGLAPVLLRAAAAAG